MRDTETTRDGVSRVAKASGSRGTIGAVDKKSLGKLAYSDRSAPPRLSLPLSNSLTNDSVGSDEIPAHRGSQSGCIARYITERRTDLLRRDNHFDVIN